MGKVRGGSKPSAEKYTRRQRELAALIAVAEVINRPLPLKEIMDQAVSKVVEVMETDGGGIRLLDQETGELVIVSSKGLSQDYIYKVDRIPLGEGVVGKVAQSGEPMVVQDLGEASEWAARAVAEEGFTTLAVVPVRTKEEIVGTLGVATQHAYEFTRYDLELLTAIGDQIGVAVENERLHQEALSAERLVAVGRVATSVAHDLRSPLGGILRSAEFLARPEITPDTRQKLSQAIVSLAQRLINTTQQILDYALGEDLSLNLQPYPLSDFLDEVLAILQVDFSDQGIEVACEYGFEGALVMDPDRMAQVVYNLAANARDAMLEGGRFIVSTQKKGDQAVLKFTDTGPGVPAEFTERIFEPFFTYGKRQGAGLGLAIARHIVEAHGGTLRLGQEDRQGAEFVMTLPL
jgi:signal transduction histidine kinase